MTQMTKHSFDMISGTQEVFRLLLDALANPGRSVDMSFHASQFVPNSSLLALALTLLDNETGFFYKGRPEICEEIRFLSGAEQAPPEKADFVFLTSHSVPSGASGESSETLIYAGEILSELKAGTFRDPHDSALVFIETSGKAEHTTSINIKGPGVPPEGRNLLLSSEEAAWIKARDKQQYEYPQGVEIIFIREDSSLFAITRKAVVTWPM